jgi:2-phosphosulfolactate phosphatase
VRSQIRRCIDGAKAASGTVVVIDVFRASNTILMLLARGASAVIPVMTVKDACAMKERFPEYLLAGERKGITVEGFDMGNSPEEASTLDMKGRRVILTTSACTKGIGHARKAERILVGSFGNADALIRMLRESKPSLVTWLAIGTEAVSKAVEDELCADYLKALLEDRPTDFSAHKSEILKGEGADRLRRLGQTGDFDYCLTTDLFDFVPQVRVPSTKGLPEIVTPVRG